MKTALTALIAAVLMALALAATGLGGNGHTPVTICHKGNIITVDDSAVKAHLAHGDSIGACVVTPPPVTPPPVTPPPVNPPVVDPPGVVPPKCIIPFDPAHPVDWRKCITIPVVTVPVQCSCQCNLKPILKRLAKLEAQVKALQKKRP